MKELQTTPNWVGSRQKRALEEKQQQRAAEERAYWQHTTTVLSEQLEMMTDDCQSLQLAIIGLLLSGTILISLMAGLVIAMIP